MGAINLEYIKKRRKELKVSMEEMASSLGLSTAGSYHPYETGRADFKASHLPLLCEKLNCNIEDLFQEGYLPNEKTVGEMLDFIKNEWRKGNA